MSKSDKSEPRSGGQFLPPAWSSPPEPVAASSEELRLAALARQAARAARDAAEAALKAAERSDDQAADAAARSGRAAPSAEAPAARAQLDGEQRREVAAKRTEQQARLRLGRLLREYGPGWAEAELAALEAEHAATVELLDQAEARAAQLYRRMMLVQELRTQRPGPVEHGRRLRVHERAVEANVGGLFNSARDTLREMVPQTRGQTDAEQRDAERTEENRQAVGGAFVPGGEF